MGVPVSVRLDDDVRGELEAQAQARGVGLSTHLRDLVTHAARQAQRARIRQASEAVGQRVAASPDAQAFYQDWGQPRADAG